MTTEQTNTIKTILEQVDLFKNNPAGIKRVVYNQLRAITEGKINIVDPTTPFNSLLESACVLTSAFMVEHETSLRKQYPSLAQTEDDLYLHMSDKDYIDRFASPALTRFHLLIDLNELKSKLVLDPLTGIRKVVIPRNSEFIIADTTFSLQYPIEIKQLSHGGFQVVYDATEVSPLQTLHTNLVDWSIQTVSVNKQELLHLEFDTYQFNIRSYKGDLLISSGYRKRHAFDDQFYHARVYFSNNATNNEWQEIYTTHSDQVYDPNTATAVLTVYQGELEVMIPQIYFTTNLVSGSIRIDIYQTKGPVSMILENYKPSAFSANFILIDKNKITPEIAAFQSIQSVFPYANKTVYGGKDALPFSKLRDKVIKNSIGANELPITNVQIESALDASGFDIVKNVDVITNRQFLATRLLPKPFDDKLVTAASASIGSLIASMDQLKTNTLVRDNGARLTIVPEMLFENKNGIIKVLNQNDLTALSTLSKEDLVKKVNNQNYLYTPFHYVLDSSENSFEVRPYYLNKPQALSTQFISQNDTTQLQVSTGTYKLVKTLTGYKLYIEVISNEAYKALDDSLVHLQLAFTPEGENTKAYLNGQIVGLTDTGERLFEFDISSRFDIDHKDHIWFNSFSILNPGLYKLSSTLDKSFTLLHSTSALLDSSWSSHQEDGELGLYLLPARIAFITKETIQLKFGTALTNLWSSARSIVAASAYQTYTTDLPAVYDNDVFERDPVTGSAFTFDINGNIVYNVLHHAGDPVLDANNQPVYKHRIGDIILDSDNKPLAISENTVMRQLDMLFIEGCYYFADDTAANIYKETIVDAMADWISIDLQHLNDRLLEQTHIYYYPKMTMGNITVMNESGAVTSMEASQSFHIRLYVPESTYENESLRKELSVSTIRSIDEHLKNSTISVSALTSELKTLYSNDVIGFDVAGFGKDNKTLIVSVLNDSDRFAIKKKLQAQPDGKLIVTESVMIDFIKHNLN